MEESKVAKRQVKIRDKQIETLTKDINEFQYKNSQLKEELTELR